MLCYEGSTDNCSDAEGVSERGKGTFSRRIAPFLCGYGGKEKGSAVSPGGSPKLICLERREAATAPPLPGRAVKYEEGGSRYDESGNERMAGKAQGDSAGV